MSVKARREKEMRNEPLKLLNISIFIVLYPFILHLRTWTNMALTVLLVPQMYEDVEGRVGEGKNGRREQGHANGSPKVHCSQSQGHLSPIPLTYWPQLCPDLQATKRRTWVRTALNKDASSQVTFGSKNRKSTQRKQRVKKEAEDRRELEPRASCHQLC